MGALNIAIAGCGPGGMAAALLLHRDGHKLTIFERFERPRALGSGLMLQPTGLAVLAALGLRQQVCALGSRIDRLFGQAGGRTVLDVRYSALGGGDSHGVGIHRASLFAVLHDAVVSAGIGLETGRTIAGSHRIADGRRRVDFDDGTSVGPFDLVVDALGSRSSLAPVTGRALAYGALWASLDWPGEAGFDAAALAQRYHRASVMAGVLPIGTPPGATAPQAALFWSLRNDKLESWQASGLTAWKTDVAALWPATLPLLEQIASAEQLTFARYSHRTLKRPGEAALVHIGDAWHSASPQLGQGANMALLDAYAVAQALRTCPDVADAIALAVRLRSNHVRAYQAMSALFTPVYQSDSRLLPLLRDTIVGPVSKLWPATWLQAAMVSGLVGGPLGPLDLRM